MGGTGRRKGKTEQLQGALSESASELQEAMVNGDEKLNGKLEKIHTGIEKQENIFLFIPNLIGKSSSSLSPPLLILLQVIPASS
jgi:hypothetical protein